MGAALLVVDMQNAYFEDPVLEGQRTEVVAACNRLVVLARSLGAPVFTVVTEHARDTSTWTLSMLEDNQGFAFTGTRQAALLDDLDAAGATTVVKIRDSAFHGTDLAQRLRALGAQRLVLCGVSGQDCIARTGADAFANDFAVAYAMDAIGSIDPELGRQTLGKLASQYRQEQLETSAVGDWMRAKP
ncbi:MAG: isochorismatase family cysteine hydrolase [Arthrobacter sp.]|uniref:cysteine hydrolase family protein n=1 Tax=Arthrobacter sp. TaxID=1667 RepID=UPI0034793945